MARIGLGHVAGVTRWRHTGHIEHAGARRIAVLETWNRPGAANEAKLHQALVLLVHLIDKAAEHFAQHGVGRHEHRRAQYRFLGRHRHGGKGARCDQQQ